MTKKNDENHKEFFLQLGPFTEQEKYLFKSEMQRRNIKIGRYLKDLALREIVNTKSISASITHI